MKRVMILFLFVVFCWSPLAYSGEKIVANTPTGDAKLDRSLEILNEGAKENIGEFAKKLGQKFGISEQTTERLLKRVGMSPGDVYMAAKVSNISKRSIEDVENAYKEKQGKGWGVIAKELGIKPGSKEFHELKKDDSGMLSEYKNKEQMGKDKEKKGKKEKNKGNKGKSKGKKIESQEGDEEAVLEKEHKEEEKGFFEKWFGIGKKKKETAKE